MTHWAFDYIGKPWVVASDGPDAYDCWGLVVAVQRRLYGHDLSIIPVAENDMKTLIRTMRDHPNGKTGTRWQRRKKAMSRYCASPATPSMSEFGWMWTVAAFCMPFRALGSCFKA
jgi:hypothetical protein